LLQRENEEIYMKVPLSWVKDFVDLPDSLIDLARRLTLAGLEVEEIHLVGWSVPESERQEFKISGISWDAEKIVVGAIWEVMPHPNADRLVLCRLDDGVQEQIVLTGAPNLFPYKGKGQLEKPLKVAYAREGARLYDGHQPGQVLMTLKRAKIRGVDSYSMACSEKELGISDEHEGIIILDDDAPVGVPLADYMGDVVFEIAITPNIARDANILGVAREIAALTSAPLRPPSYELPQAGPPIQGLVSIEIKNPELNPRFVLGLIRDIQIGPSPYWVQRRLRLAGMRPISNIVDCTNYAMLEVGEPLHAFDYDALVKRAGGKAPLIITRTAHPGEHLMTLDDVDRPLNEFTVLVTDTAGALSIGGVMGGAETEVHPGTRNVLLEGAAWNFINVRRTLMAQKLQSEAGYRFSRGVHPAMAERGVRRGLALMQQWAGGTVAQGLVDNYPLPPQDPIITITPQDVSRWLGIRLTAGEIAEILKRLEFRVQVDGQSVTAATPDHRMDINTGLAGKADLMEEIARVYGYDRLPETRIADALPPQRANPAVEGEERLRDLLVELGLQEVVTYRMTSAEREARLAPDGQPLELQAYVRLANPSSSDRSVLRRSLLSSVLEIVERNARITQRQALFEIGPVFYPSTGGDLPQELARLVIVLTGRRDLPAWQDASSDPMDFYDLKGVLEAMAAGLHLADLRFEPAEWSSYHPGKCARFLSGEQELGVFGELNPLLLERFELPPSPLLAAELDLDVLMPLVPDRFQVEPVPAYPPALEDLAVIVDEELPADRVKEVIQQGGGKTVTEVKLFDVYRGEQIGPGKKSLAYSLTYQSPDHTLTDQELVQTRQRIIRRLEQELGAHLRS
jgi:phenylalanyl-tRNA synthetase beta chain